MHTQYYDMGKNSASNDISLLFNNWVDGDERIAIFSPHDDDALIGSGYAAVSALENNAEVYVIIFCNGDAGYSIPEQKDGIVETRIKETAEAYGSIGIPEKNILRLEYSDFSVFHNIGYKLSDGHEGAFPKVVQTLRSLKITRVLIPNGYREHIDHEAVFKISSYDAVQAGDPIFSDWGLVKPVKSILQYSVWADFDPVNYTLFNSNLRANRAVSVHKEIEDKIRKAIYSYRSQGKIIESLIAQREERRLNNDYIEVYVEYDGRPKLDYKPYIEKVLMIQGGDV